MAIKGAKMIIIDKNKVIVSDKDDVETVYDIGSREAFSILSKVWLRSGWDTKYVYSFTWMGRPIIQLPDDMLRMQEVIYQVKPDVIIETGIAHGGSLIFYASLCKAMGNGRIIGVDIEIRPHNRQAIEEHELYSYITLVEGNSIKPDIVNQVKALVNKDDRVFIILDSNHSKEHVLSELEAYSPLLTSGSFIVATDGIMKDLVGAPRSQPDWGWNNPYDAVQEFIVNNSDFQLITPEQPFNEGLIVDNCVTYWPGAWLKKK
ncbi:cephalosporin hydroxylase family protein [Thermodesulfobacteriota bacterium]